MNIKYKTSFADEEIMETEQKIFDECNFKGLNTFDLRLYNLPIVLRKVLIHMRRNEIVKVMTNYIDYFHCNDVELKNVNTGNEANIVIYVHLYKNLNRRIFSNLPHKDKYEDLMFMKELANKNFKEGKLYRACKIYQNINYRFNYGDVFGNIVDMEAAEKQFKEKDEDLFKKLMELRLASHSNLAAAKFKLGKYNSSYEVASKVKI